MSTVGASLIVRDVSDRLPACLDSIKPYVDEIVIVDTGSTDNTLEIARKYTDKVYTFTDCNFPADAEPHKVGKICDFAMARNYSLSKCTTDYVFWCDSDDMLVGGEHLRGIIATADGANVNNIWTEYKYAFDHHGNVICTHWRERIVKRDCGFYWKGFVHEVLLPGPGIQGVVMRTDHVKNCPTFYIKHMRQYYPKIASQSNTRNLDILEYHLKGKDLRQCDPRDVFYYGNELNGCGRLDEAKEAYEAYIDKTSWIDEKYKANHEIADIYRKKGEYDNSIQQDLKGLLVTDYPDSYFGIAEGFYFKEDWPQVIRWTELGFQKRWPQDTVMVLNPMDYSYRPHVYYNVALGKVGRVHDALRSVEAGLSVAPDDPHLNFNRGFYQQEINKLKVKDATDTILGLEGTPDLIKNCVRIVAGSPLTEDAFLADPPNTDPKVIEYLYVSMWKHLMQHGETKKATNLLDGAPSYLTDSPWLSRARDMTVVDPRPTVAIYTGQAYEKWDGNSPNKGGIGGSETMAINMAEELAKSGYKVYVFCDCDRSIVNDVSYIPYQQFVGGKFDVFIASRIPDVIDKPITADVKLLWIHDIHCGVGLTYERSLKFDKILCLSQWHKQFVLETYPMLNPEQIVVTRNGVNPARFDEIRGIKRDPKKMVYTSSPDRGLERLLDMWPDIRTQIPDAELHTYYGFNNWVQINNTPQQEAIKRIKDKMQQPGVTDHGRIAQDKLADEFRSAGIWAYPTSFSETSCLSAMEAQMAGCIPVINSVAALTETVQCGYVSTGVDENSQEFRQWFIERLIDALQWTPGQRNEISEAAVTKFNLYQLRQNWLQLFEGIKEEKQTSPATPLYMPREDFIQ